MKTGSLASYVLRLAMTLLLITAVVAAALAGVNSVTKPEIERLTAENGGLPQESLTKMIDSYTADYVETLGGARRRLNRALEIILTSYYANTLKLRADALVHGLRDR